MGKQEIKDTRSRKIIGILNADEEDLIIEIEGEEMNFYDLVKDFNGYDIKVELTKDGELDD